MKYRNLTILFVFVMLLVAACGGGGDNNDGDDDASGGNTTIEVIQNDIYYGDTPDNAENPPTWTVTAGETITVQATNNGGLDHNFAIVKPDAELPATFDEEANSDLILQETGLVEAGSTFNDSLDALDPGEYVVICTVAGHYPSMQGRLIVEGG